MHVMDIQRLALVAAATACLGGCSTSPPANALVTISYMSSTPGEGDTSLLTGTVVDVGGCFGVESAGETYVPAFPTYDDTPRTVSLGDEVSLGGSQHINLPSGADVPEPCSTPGPYWLVVSEP